MFFCLIFLQKYLRNSENCGKIKKIIMEKESSKSVINDARKDNWKYIQYV